MGSRTVGCFVFFFFWNYTEKEIYSRGIGKFPVLDILWLVMSLKSGHELLELHLAVLNGIQRIRNIETYELDTSP